MGLPGWFRRGGGGSRGASGWGVHLLNAGGPFTKMGGPYCWPTLISGPSMQITDVTRAMISGSHMGSMALYVDVSDWTLFLRVSLILVAWVIG